MTDMFLTAYNGQFLGPIAKALGYLMNWIYDFQSNVLHLDSIALVILLFTIVIYLILFPLTYRQQKFSVLSQKMNPEINAIREKYKNKKDQASVAAMQEETQSVYDKYGISPFGSCLQLFIQMPILFALYRVFYNIPAYIGSVKNIFSGLVNGIIATPNYDRIMDKFYKAANVKAVTVDIAGNGSATDKNYIIDVLYKLSDKDWDKLHSYFPKLADDINSTHSSLQRVNSLFGVNISDTPWNLIATSISDHAYLILFISILLPILSYLSQVINIKVGQLNNNLNDDDPMARQMKSMNLMMPLMSLFFAFTVPAGLTLYWIFGAVVRTVQMYLLNKKFANIDLDEIIEKNKEAAQKKKEKRGIKRAQIYEAAKMNTRNTTLSSRANSVKANVDNTTFEYKKQNFKKGSLAEKANLVNEYNHGSKK